MALKGSLDDMGIVDLIQFFGQSRKTGVLLLNSEGQEARLYYRKGNLTDARAGQDSGMDVVSHVIDWTGGDFEFQAGVESDDPVLDIDLPRALMTAVKIRDERKMAEERRRQEEEARRKQEEELKRQAEEARRREQEELERRVEEARRQEQETRLEEQRRVEQALDPETCAQLNQWISGAEFVQHVAILNPDGWLIAEAHGHQAPANGFREVSKSLHAFARHYTRSDMKRVVIEDEAGTVVLARMPQDRALVVAADRAASLGVVCVTFGKLLARLSS